MTEHGSFKAKVVDAGGGEVRLFWERTQTVDYPPTGAEVTVTWTEPPEPSGRWVVVTCDTGEHRRPAWEAVPGRPLFIPRFHSIKQGEIDRAEAALVDLIESDHLPPQMPSVDDISEWLARNGYVSSRSWGQREVIRGTLDAIAALDAHARTGT